MKKLFFLAFATLAFSSCATLFTSSKQDITFAGIEGTKIYDATNNMKLGEIGSDQTVTIPFKKKMSDKQLLAKKEGYQTTPILLESSFNTTALWNILFWPGFIVDLGTGQMNKWDNTYVSIDMQKVNDNSASAQ